MPESDGAFLQEAGIAGAGAAARRSELIRGWKLGRATAVVGERRAVATNLVQLERRGGRRRNCRRGQRRWDCGGCHYGDAVVALVRGATSVLSAVIGVDIELLGSMNFDSGQAMPATNRGLRAIRTESQIGKLAGAVATDAISIDSLAPDFKLLGEEWNFESGAAATTATSIVVCPGRADREATVHRAGDRGGDRRLDCVVGVRTSDTARIDAIAERAKDTEDFIVAPSGIDCRLDDRVGRFVDGVSGCIHEVVQAAAVAWSVDEGVAGRRDGGRADSGGADGGEASSADGGLWSFDRETQSKLATEILHDAEGILAGPCEADHVLWVNDHGQVFLAVLDTLLVGRGSGPHLAACEAPAVVEGCLCVNLALAEDV